MVGILAITAIIVGFTAVVAYGFAAIRFSTYPSPWSLPWQSGSLGWRPAAINAAVRLAVLSGIAVLIAWPYFQGETVSFGREFGLGFFPSTFVRHVKVDLTWLVIVSAAATLVAVGLLIVWSLPDRRVQQRVTDSQAPVGLDAPTLSDLTGASLEAMMSESDPRRAILTCYARMEQRLASWGVPRNLDETANEYMLRVLERSAAPRDSVRSLTRLFNIAGFSLQPVDESKRVAAISALKAISGGNP